MNVVKFRTQYVADKITELTVKTPPPTTATNAPSAKTPRRAASRGTTTNAVPPSVPGVTPAKDGGPNAVPASPATAPPATGTNAPPAKGGDEVARPSVESPSPSAHAGEAERGPDAAGPDWQIAADKALLEAKLKEVLSAQPAILDPHELAKAQDQIRALQKENELLKVSLADARTGGAPARQLAVPGTGAAASAG